MDEQKYEEKCLVDEDEKEEEEKMRTREKGDWMGNESRMKQFLNFVDSSEVRARSIKADRSKRRENNGSRVLKMCLICDSVLKELSFNH